MWPPFLKYIAHVPLTISLRSILYHVNYFLPMTPSLFYTGSPVATLQIPIQLSLSPKMILLTIRTGKPRSTKFQAPRDLVTQTTNTSEVELPLPLLGLV